MQENSKTDKVSKETKERKLPAAKKPTVEQLMKQIEDLQKKVQNRPASLEEQISFFEEKKKKINHLRMFTKTKQEIESVLVDIRDAIDAAKMDSEYFKLQVIHGRYSTDTTKLSIGNNHVIAAALTYVMSEIDLKVAELETKISE